MAFKSVVTSRFFDEMIKFVEGLDTPITLAMLDSPDVTGPERWNLSLAAPWLDEISLAQATRMINAQVAQQLGAQAVHYGSTFIRRTGDYLVRSLVPVLDVPEPGTAYSFRGLELSLFNLDEVVVLIANPNFLPIPLSA
jgi:hypothetical protein